MRRLVPGVLLSVPVLVLLGSGCKKTPVPQSSTATRPSAAKGELLRPALDLLRQGTDLGRYRDALNVINAQLTKDGGKQVGALTPQEIENLRQVYRLDEPEVADLGATLFRPEDAYHLQESCLFRDAAGRLLEVADATPLEQARIAFDWIIRRIDLHEQGDENLPPTFVLRRGFGSARDRAVAFLALARQFQLEGCLLAPAGAHDPVGPLLVGILLPEQKASLYLFDPRLGMPVPGPGNQGIATLAEARRDPGLLKRTAVPPDIVSKLEAYQAGPIEALAPRMRYLQALLQLQDKVVLFQNAAEVGRDLAKATGQEARVWPSDPKQPSPARAWRLFLPPEEGGIDKSGRLRRFQNHRIPAHAILQQFQAMRLLNSQEFPNEARDILLRKTDELFKLFALQPKEFFLHGQLAETLKRLDRMRNVLDSDEAARPLEDEDFQASLNNWRRGVNGAYVAMLVRHDPAGKAKVDALWAEDLYLLNLFDVDSEYPLQKFEKKFLTLLLLNVCREPLGHDVNHLVASCRHERAAKLQANLEARSAAGKNVAKIQEDADSEWKNTRSEWSRYVERYQVAMSTLPTRLAPIVQSWQRGDGETAVSLLEQLHRDIHTSLQARLRLAEAQRRLKTSNSSLPSLRADLDALQGRSDLPKVLSDWLEKARFNSPSLAQRLELLARDWGPQGNLRWLAEAARRHVDDSK